MGMIDEATGGGGVGECSLRSAPTIASRGHGCGPSCAWTMRSSWWARTHCAVERNSARVHLPSTPTAATSSSRNVAACSAARDHGRAHQGNGSRACHSMTWPKHGLVAWLCAPRKMLAVSADSLRGIDLSDNQPTA